MSNNVELIYDNLNTVITNLEAANNILDSVYKTLGDSTDLGSSIMQSFWKFNSKDAIFDDIKIARKYVKQEKQENQSISKCLRSIPDIYEKAAKMANADTNNSNLKDELIKLGLITYIMPTSTFFAGIIAPWAAYHLVSQIRPKQSAPVVTNIADRVTNGVTALHNAVASSSGVVGAVALNVDTSGKVNVSQQHVDSAAVAQATAVESASTVGLTEKQFNDLVGVLSKYSNTRYVKGGSSTSGIDCSGLVMNAYAEAGIKADFVHKASNIYNQCEPVGSYTKENIDLNVLKKGDLVFYSDGGTDSISHVGIYMGDGKVMSTLNSNEGVQTKSITYTYKKNIYVARVKK